MSQRGGGAPRAIGNAGSMQTRLLAMARDIADVGKGNP